MDMTCLAQKFKSSRLIQFCIMADNLLQFLYVQLAFNIVFNVGFGALFIRKILKLDRLAQDHEVKIPKVVWIKFTIILVLILLLVLHLILAYSSPSYWLNSYANFSLTIFLNVANYTMQEYIILKQITKGNQARYLPNIFFWGIVVIADIIQIVAVEVLLPSPTISTILQLIICMLNFGLLLISLIFEKRKTLSTDLISALNQLNTGKSIEDSVRHRERIAPPNRLYIQFNKDFSVIPHNDGITCQFKIAVYVDQNASIVTKTDLQFLKLQQQMVKMFPNRPEVVIPPQYNAKQPNLMKYGQQRQKIFQNYLLQITKTGEFIKPCLLDFLCIPNHLRSKLVYIQRPTLINKQDTMQIDQFQKMRKPFFKVTANKGKYILQNPDFLQFIINRPVSQILQLHNKLKEQKKLTIDVLPENPKENDIVSFFEIVVNRKSLWRSFSAWFRLDLTLQNKVYNYFDPWSFGFKKITVEIVGYQIASDRQGKIHTCYLISIKPRRKCSVGTFQMVARGTTISKRYSEFCTLDKHIRKFISKNNSDYLDMLPALPPKFSPFGSKTSPKSRQMRLASYLAEILTIQGINHCIKLLQFLQFNSKVQVSQQLSFSHGFQQEQSQPSFFNDLE